MMYYLFPLIAGFDPLPPLPEQPPRPVPEPDHEDIPLDRFG